MSRTPPRGVLVVRGRFRSQASKMQVLVTAPLSIVNGALQSAEASFQNTFVASLTFEDHKAL